MKLLLCDSTSRGVSAGCVLLAIVLFVSGRTQGGDAEDRRVVVKNLQVQALAMHNFHHKHGSFPPQHLRSDDGKPLLSWRVLVLPFLGPEGKELYEQFRLNETWDSEHNRSLLSKMPAVYASPGTKAEATAEGLTRFVAPLTADTIFGRRTGPVAVKDITDGTSSTLLIVHAAAEKAVPWTRPADLTLDLNEPLFPQMQTPDGLLQWSGADGAAHIHDTDSMDEATLKALLTIDNQEIVVF